MFDYRMAGLGQIQGEPSSSVAKERVSSTYTVTRSTVSHPHHLLWTGPSENDKSRLRPRSKA